jgi:hypothetical protein
MTEKERKQQIEEHNIYYEQLCDVVGRAMDLDMSLGHLLEAVCEEWHTTLEAIESGKTQEKAKPKTRRNKKAIEGLRTILKT